MCHCRPPLRRETKSLTRERKQGKNKRRWPDSAGRARKRPVVCVTELNGDIQCHAAPQFCRNAHDWSDQISTAYLGLDRLCRPTYPDFKWLY